MEMILRDLSIFKFMNIKPNYSELARKHNVSRDTIRKYDNGYEGKPTKKPKPSVLDKYREEISNKLSIVGTRVSSVYQYFYALDTSIGSESNFRKYVTKNKINRPKDTKPHPRFETPPGLQLQFDWKEDIKMVSKYGEIFEFNIFSSILSNSRKHIFQYSKTRTREDVIRCLADTFKELDGVPKICLTDNMSSIVSNRTFCDQFKIFAKDFGFSPQKCKPYSPETKGKVESKNRFLNWLKPYNEEFETEEDLIRIIKKIEHIANEKANGTTLMPPNLLYNKEKKYLQPLPNKRIIESYMNIFIAVKVSKDSLIHYKKRKYSAPNKYINKTVKLKEEKVVIQLFFDGLLIRQHELSNNPINYHKDDYINMFKTIMDSQDIESFAENNLKLLDKIGEI
jgi:transposase